MKKIINIDDFITKHKTNEKDFFVLRLSNSCLHKKLSKIINDILYNVVKPKSSIIKNRTFLRKENSLRYSFGYKRNFLLS